jgi:Zn-dependent protease
MNNVRADESRSCARCGTEIADGLKSCPSCHQLVHASELKQLAEEAERQQASGHMVEALAAWRQALDLLPIGTRQHEVIQAKVSELSTAIDRGTTVTTANRAARGFHPKPPPRALAKGAAGLGGIGLVLWKFKFLAAMMLGKVKLLLLGLTKMKTLLSMLLAFGVYWEVWGWPFALGVVLAIYVHEMGHVAALWRFGFKASAPVFIPGIGAFVRLQQRPANARENSRIGLAGPIWGLAATIAFYLAHLATGRNILAAIAQFSAWVNLFNLIPIWQLDGGRGFSSLSRNERWLGVLAIGLMYFLTGESLLILLLICAVMQALGGGAAETDPVGLAQYACLVVALSTLCLIHVPERPHERPRGVLARLPIPQPETARA